MDQQTPKRAYFFGNGNAEGNANMEDLLGGKGAKLADMTALPLPVPPGFTITTETCREYNDADNVLPTGLMDEVKANIAKLEDTTGKKLGDPSNPLLVAVRSGAKVPMPGMMDAVLNIGLSDATVGGLARRTGDEWFAHDSYRRLINMFGDMVMGVDHEHFEHELSDVKHASAAQLDTELSTDDLKQVIERYKKVYKDHVGAAFPQDHYRQMELAIEAIFKSWRSDRSIRYREIHAITGLPGAAANVQSMVFGNMGEDSGTGVAFTRDPSSGANKLYGEFLANGQGEDVVAGIRTPAAVETLGERLPHVWIELLGLKSRLERRYRAPQDFEFTVERGQLFLLNTRNMRHTNAKAAVRISVEMVREGLIDRASAVSRVPADELQTLFRPVFDPAAPRRVIARGIPASNGVAVGRLAFSSEEVEQRTAKGEKVIYVVHETERGDILNIKMAEGLVTAVGGKTSHGAVAARGVDRPAVVGVGALSVDRRSNTLNLGGRTLGPMDWLSIDGDTGEIIEGRIPVVAPEITEPQREFLKWCQLNSTGSLVALTGGSPSAQSPAPIGTAANLEPPVDFVILTALEEERDAVLGKLDGYRKLAPSSDDVRVYYVADVPVRFSDGSTCNYCVVVLTLPNMGRVEAATATNDAIRRWRPRYVMLVGIAGGVAAQGVVLGDVLISDQVVDYELQKAGPTGSEIRWQVHRADPRMLNAARNAALDDWLHLVKAARPSVGHPTRHIGPIATGDKVVAAAELLKQQTNVWHELIGVEMEAGGAASAAFQSATQPGFFMVRGTSDLADDRKDTPTVRQWRLYACDVAAAYTIGLLMSGAVPPAADRQRRENVTTPHRATGIPEKGGRANAGQYQGPADTIELFERDKAEALRLPADLEAACIATLRALDFALLCKRTDLAHDPDDPHWLYPREQADELTKHRLSAADKALTPVRRELIEAYQRLKETRDVAVGHDCAHLRAYNACCKIAQAYHSASASNDPHEQLRSLRHELGATPVVDGQELAAIIRREAVEAAANRRRGEVPLASKTAPGEHESRAAEQAADPAWRALHADPAYQELLRRADELQRTNADWLDTPEGHELLGKCFEMKQKHGITDIPKTLRAVGEEVNKMRGLAVLFKAAMHTGSVPPQAAHEGLRERLFEVRGYIVDLRRNNPALPSPPAPSGDVFADVQAIDDWQTTAQTAAAAQVPAAGHPAQWGTQKNDEPPLRAEAVGLEPAHDRATLVSMLDKAITLLRECPQVVLFEKDPAYDAGLNAKQMNDTVAKLNLRSRGPIFRWSQPPVPPYGLESERVLTVYSANPAAEPVAWVIWSYIYGHDAPDHAKVARTIECLQSWRELCKGPARRVLTLAWNDPVWSKVIAGLILAVGAYVATHLHRTAWSIAAVVLTAVAAALVVAFRYRLRHQRN